MMDPDAVMYWTIRWGSATALDFKGGKCSPRVSGSDPEQTKAKNRARPIVELLYELDGFELVWSFAK